MVLLYKLKPKVHYIIIIIIIIYCIYVVDLLYNKLYNKSK